MKKLFFRIESKQAWVNVMQVETVFKNGNKYTLSLTSGKRYDLTEAEYLQWVSERENDCRKEEKKED